MTEKSFDSPNLAQRFYNLEENLKEVRENIAKAAEKYGRLPEEITLLAATKTVPVEVINHGIDLGINYIGENKVQEFEEKADRLHDCHVHFIGHLQRNKVKNLVGRVELIQSVDSVKLANEISRISINRKSHTDILIEVNIGREENKSGVLPEQLFDLTDEISKMPGISVKGLMAIPPICEQKTQICNYFSQMTKYFVDIKSKKIDNVTMDFLSMGMSGDYVSAIECGANMIRVGSKLFGQRNYR